MYEVLNKWLEKRLHAFANAISTPIGWLLTMLSMMVGNVVYLLTGRSDTVLLVFNLYLSELAIVIGGTLLVSQLREKLARQIKDRELIQAVQGARDDIAEVDDSLAPEQLEKIQTEQRK